MLSTGANKSALIYTIWSKQPIVRSIVLSFAGVLALIASAKIQVPFWPVPMTMQTYVLLVVSMTFGLRLCLATVTLYIFSGMLGFPVFAGTPERGLGLAYILGSTGGYLIGFMVASFVLGLLGAMYRSLNLLKTTLVMSLGTLIIFACGFSWLAIIIGATNAWLVGVQPFLLGEILKIALAVATFSFLVKTSSTVNSLTKE